MARSLLAGAAYFLIVFAAAPAPGALRVSFVVPAAEIVWTTSLELALLLAVSWATCAWLGRRCRASSSARSVTMGISAFVLLMAAEAGRGGSDFWSNVERSNQFVR
jgi:hypothetical protein